MIEIDFQECPPAQRRGLPDRATEIEAGAVRHGPAPEGSAQVSDTIQDDAELSNTVIESSIRDSLEQHPHFRGRAALLQVESVEGMVILSGRLPSLYLKQLLQEAVGRIHGVVDIDNQVFVMRPNQ
jgi:osmotically-inducible protein OsmY